MRGNLTIDTNFDGKTVKITSTNGYVASNLNIPSKIRMPDKHVCVLVSISDSAFRESSITGKLTIPNTITSIGEFAFRDCNGLTGSLTIPNSVISIGAYAFAGCTGLTGSFTIGSNVNSIGFDAFRECKFNNIDIDDTNPTYGLATNVGDAKIVVRKATIEGQVVCLKNYNLYDIVGSLASGQLTIPNSVTSIGVSAFDKCVGLTGSLTIGHNVNNIDDYAFYSCNGFANITLDGYSSTPSWSAGRYIFYE
jgi:hypothetical protein